MIVIDLFKEYLDGLGISTTVKVLEDGAVEYSFKCRDRIIKATGGSSKEPNYIRLSISYDNPPYITVDELLDFQKTWKYVKISKTVDEKARLQIEQCIFGKKKCYLVFDRMLECLCGEPREHFEKIILFS